MPEETRKRPILQPGRRAPSRGRLRRLIGAVLGSALALAALLGLLIVVAIGVVVTLL